MSPESNTPDIPPEGSPDSDSPPALVWLFVLLAVLAFWGMAFLDNHAGGFEAMVYAPYKSVEEVGEDWPTSEADRIIKLGKVVYEEKAKCTLCHQATGLGTSGQYPPLAASDWVQAKEPGHLIRLVLDGMQGPLTLNGQPFNTPAAMPPWKDILTDEDIAAVLTYIRQEWGNNSSSVTTEQVSTVRQKVASRASSWTPDELLKIPETE